MTAAPATAVIPETDPSAVAKGQTVAFDVTIKVPNGTLRDLRLAAALPGGPASLAFVSASVISIGSNIQAAAPQIAADGTLQFGNVTLAPGAAGGDTITARVTVRADGTASGPATLQTIVSAADPSSPGGRWSANVASSVGVVVPPAAPLLSGIWTAQKATTTMMIHPFGGLVIDGGNQNGLGTLAITLQDGTLGRLSTSGPGSLDPAGRTFVATGALPTLQDAARQLVFTPAPTASGPARLAVTVVDSSGGIAQDGATAVAISSSADTGRVAQHFAPAPGTTFLTATADGQRTLAGGETYQGPVDYLRAQYIYDGWDPVVIVAQTPNVFVKNFYGDAAVALQSGQNVVDAGKGSNFLIGGTGTDVFFLDGRSNAVTWNTIVGFHPGDIATLFGFKAGVSSSWWEDRAGATGFEGRTLRADLQGQGGITASLTFAGSTAAVTDTYALTTGQIGGIDYMTIFAL